MSIDKITTNIIQATKPIAQKITKTVAQQIPTADTPIGLGAEALAKQNIAFLEKAKKILTELIPEDSELFSWATKKPSISFEKIDPESLVLVHMTDFMPQSGKIQSARLATTTQDGIGLARNTVHFALNKAVSEHNFGFEWSKMDYAIIAPFSKVVQDTPASRVIGGFQDDFFFLEEVNLPKGSVILKRNPDIPSGKMQVSDLSGGIKLVESSNPNTGEVANLIIEKMGYENYTKALQQHLGATEEELNILLKMKTDNPAFGEAIDFDEAIEQAKNMLDDFESFFDGLPEEQIQEIKKQTLKTLEDLNLAKRHWGKMDDFSKGWRIFCEENHYVNNLHSQTPWSKSEMSIWAVEMVEKLNKNSWGEYKKFILDELIKVQEDLPQNKNIGMDIPKLKSIIKESKTPKEAKERIASELKIKAMPPKNAQDITTGFDDKMILDSLLALVFQ